MTIRAATGDGALPFSALWRRVSPRTGTPTAAVLLTVAVAALLALPALYSKAAYGAVTAIAVIGITPAYAIPIFLRLRYKERFRQGKWNLGRWGVPIGWTAVVWVAFVTLLFCLPQTSPITVDSFNYAPVALICVLGLASFWWAVAGRGSYTTPTFSTSSGDRELAEMSEEIV